MEIVLTYRGRQVSQEDAASIQELIDAHPSLSRRRLSVKLCELWDWYQANGAPRDMVCRSLMLALHGANRPIKDVLGYPLTKKFRKLMSS